MQERPELFILTSEQFEEHWKHHDCLHVVFTSHNLQASNHRHSHFWVQNSIVLLKQVKNLIGKESRKLLFVYSTDMGHKL